MIYKKEERNFNKVQFQNIREEVDQTFNDLHDELSDCYYNFWKQELSKPFIFRGKSFDKEQTVDKSKELFDKLHGMIFHLREVEFHNVNSQKPVEEKIPEEKYRFIYDEDGSIKKDIVQDSLTKIDDFDKLEKITKVQL